MSEDRLEDIEERKKLDGKIDPTVSTGVFLVMLGVGIPVWIGLLIPMTALYQGYKALLPKKKEIAAVSHTEQDVASFPKVAELVPLKERKYDLVLLGATGFTGKLATQYLAKTYGAKGQVKWAIAGRSITALEGVKAEVARKFGDSEILNIDTIVVDTLKRDTLHGLVNNARAVASTAGPFAMHGSNVVEFCARYGTSYVDITGEVDWSREMITKWDAIAQKTGAKIVSFCGHDSVPWDLTVHKMADMLSKECKDDLVEAECLDELKGAGVSGGTIASLLQAIDGNYTPPRYPFDPLLKKADGSQSSHKTALQSPMFFMRCGQERFMSRWQAPFLMAQINGAVVKRSNALSGGNLNVTYKEALLVRDFKTAFVSTFALYIAGTALLNPITGTLMRNFLLPKPGQGPTENAMEKGYLCVYGFGKGSQGNRVESAMYFPKDAGYMDTARILIESGLCLALDKDTLPVKAGGCFTPSTGMGDALVRRLIKTGTLFRCRVVSDRSKL